MIAKLGDQLIATRGRNFTSKDHEGYDALTRHRIGSADYGSLCDGWV
jgi:hypothetical protein